jgi:hypothetical protein
MVSTKVTPSGASYRGEYYNPEFPVSAIYCEVLSSLFSYQAVSHFLKTVDLEIHRILESGCRTCLQPVGRICGLLIRPPDFGAFAATATRRSQTARNPGCRVPYRPGAVRDLFSNALAFRDSVGALEGAFPMSLAPMSARTCGYGEECDFRYCEGFGRPPTMTLSRRGASLRILLHAL